MTKPLMSIQSLLCLFSCFGRIDNYIVIVLLQISCIFNGLKIFIEKYTQLLITAFEIQIAIFVYFIFY